MQTQQSQCRRRAGQEEDCFVACVGNSSGFDAVRGRNTLGWWPRLLSRQLHRLLTRTQPPCSRRSTSNSGSIRIARNSSRRWAIVTFMMGAIFLWWWSKVRTRGTIFISSIRRNIFTSSKAISGCASGREIASWIISFAKGKRFLFRPMSRTRRSGRQIQLGLWWSGGGRRVSTSTSSFIAIIVVRWSKTSISTAAISLSISAKRCSIFGTTIRVALARNVAGKSRSLSRWSHSEEVASESEPDWHVWRVTSFYRIVIVLLLASSHLLLSTSHSPWRSISTPTFFHAIGPILTPSTATPDLSGSIITSHAAHEWWLVIAFFAK